MATAQDNPKTTAFSDFCNGNSAS